MFQKKNKIDCLILFVPLLALIAAYLTHRFFTPELMQVDSGGYIHFSPTRTVGYPVFLSFFSNLNYVPLVQWLIYGLGVWTLARVISNHFGKPWGYLIAVLSFLNPEWNKYHFNILTESLSSSLLIFLLAGVFSFVKERQLKSLAFVSVMVGLGILIRPINYTWLAASIMLLLAYGSFQKSAIIKQLLTALMPLGVILLAGMAMYAQHHGEFKTQSFLGHNLIGKAGVFAQESCPTDQPKFMKSLAEKTKPITKAVGTLSIMQGRYMYSASYYDHIRYSLLNEVSKEQNISLSDQDMLNLSKDIIRCHPMAFLKDSILNYAALWLLLDIKTSFEAFQDKLFINANPEMAKVLWNADYLQNARPRPDWLVYGVRLCFGIAGLLSLLFSLNLFITSLRARKPSDFLVMAGVSGALIQSGYMVIAVLQAGLPRYAMSFWPCLLFLFVVVCHHILNKFLRSE